MARKWQPTTTPVMLPIPPKKAPAWTGRVQIELCRGGKITAEESGGANQVLR